MIRVKENNLRRIFKKTVTVAVLGAVALSIPTAVSAKRIHDTKVETKAELRQIPENSQVNDNISMDTNAATEDAQIESRVALQEKIDAILNSRQREREALGGQLEEPQFEAQQPYTMVQVPQTISASDPLISGTAMATQRQCVKYLIQHNPNPNIAVSAEELVAYYYEEGAREGIRPDVAFAQALIETGFFRYGGTVTPDQNNYCGLGTTSSTVKGVYFADPRLGVRAHIQHLLAYSSTRRPSTPIVDPRYELVRGTVGNRPLSMWSDLNGRWAVPGNSYSQSIMSTFHAMLNQ